MAMLEVSMSMHIDTDNGKSLKTSYDMNDRGEEAKMCIF